MCSVVPDSLQPRGLQPTRLLCPWGSPGKNTGVGCHALLQGIFLTQGSNSHLLHGWVDSLSLSHLESPFSLIDLLNEDFCLVAVKSHLGVIGKRTQMLKYVSSTHFKMVWSFPKIGHACTYPACANVSFQFTTLGRKKARFEVHRPHRVHGED